jgi:hypothetical protein
MLRQRAVCNTEFNGAKFYLPKPVEYKIIPSEPISKNGDIPPPPPRPQFDGETMKVCFLAPGRPGCPAAD